MIIFVCVINMINAVHRFFFQRFQRSIQEDFHFNFLQKSQQKSMKIQRNFKTFELGTFQKTSNNDASTAFTHSTDFDRLYELSAFDVITKRADHTLKPVGIVLSDGGPDENPRYSKTIYCAIQHFKKYDFDALFLATNAPGRSAFNPVERRMAPLSKEILQFCARDKWGHSVQRECSTIQTSPVRVSNEFKYWTRLIGKSHTCMLLVIGNTKDYACQPFFIQVLVMYMLLSHIFLGLLAKFIEFFELSHQLLQCPKRFKQFRILRNAPLSQFQGIPTGFF